MTDISLSNSSPTNISAELLIRDYSSSDFYNLRQLLSAVYNSNIAQSDLETHYLGADNEILLAVIDDVIVGCAFLEYRADYIRDRHTVFVTYVAVHEAFRHRGIGRTMFSEIETRARSRNCTALELTSADSRVGAHAFYHRMNFTKKKTTVFIKEL